MLDFRPILYIIGILLTTLAAAMCAPLIADLVVGHPDWQVFAAAAALTAFIGITLLFTTMSPPSRLSVRQAFVLTTASWVAMTFFAALPFAFADLDLGLTDAFFEAMSGLTTTGSTVISNLDSAPNGILLWRAILQWLGGIGIIVMSIAILPMLKIGGNQLFQTESSDGSEKVMPRVAQVASGVGFVYLALTLACATLLWFSGLRGFDAIAHAMTTIATGGFSTRDGSIGAFVNPSAEIIITSFMLLGALPFALYLQALRGKPLLLWRDNQVRWFFLIVAFFVMAVTVAHYIKNDINIFQALRESAFNVTSIITGTGYSSANYASWGSFATGVFFFIMFIGGCAGSTTCSIKIFRYQILYQTAKVQMKHLIRPHGIFIGTFNGRPITDEIENSVMSFFFLFMLIFAIIAGLLHFIGLDFLTAISGAASAICNVGPALGDTIGPTGNFSALPDSAKWVLSAGMLLGRLELFTVLVLFAPWFWRG
ncbi:MAG: Trk system potassium uptake protein TrkI [Alphaproteobacteria bacterium MarineAlpha11_Bin1]|nr:MAG: Trk system potassium uptake protein TrkI [Alphaproteobacteria bacterium MarineAlpha11_Bin1]